ncbi:hypothetical protein BJ170DRAFT_681527 [Xylariales sp. AK1849]|nr:hypothetical protein BJ170DRAFT_681527 [Xylariales sp. AK1849]
MGGKVWSDKEEKHFWRVTIPRSAKRVGIDRAKSERSWASLARSMQLAMKEDARRTYTGTMLFEHYFQNIESQRRSPNAALYVREYLRKGGRPFRGGPRASSTRGHASITNGTETPGTRGPGQARSDPEPTPRAEVKKSSSLLLTEDFLETPAGNDETDSE